ncbi:MAG: hypothetical protein JWN23_1991 [Rhodocyclales bacterium]|nr:hypothetical protein [Rhodocyclales bacterium]
MVKVLQILTFFLVVLAMVPAAAHALELPGKLRLTKDAYIAVQPIYYPGFTIVGMAEPAAIISAIVLLVLMPWGGADCWLTVLALFGLVSMHAVYWLFTHPVNNFWLQSENLGRVGSGFFAWGSAGKRSHQSEPHSLDWTQLRNRWEYSHVARAGLAALSFTALVIVISCAGCA